MSFITINKDIVEIYTIKYKYNVKLIGYDISNVLY